MSGPGGDKPKRETGCNMLGEVESFELSALKEIEFVATDACQLRLQFSKEVLLEFPDDTSRECWRRAIAFALKSSKASYEKVLND